MKIKVASHKSAPFHLKDDNNKALHQDFCEMVHNVIIFSGAL